MKMNKSLILEAYGCNKCTRYRPAINFATIDPENGPKSRQYIKPKNNRDLRCSESDLFRLALQEDYGLEHYQLHVAACFLVAWIPKDAFAPFRLLHRLLRQEVQDLAGGKP